MTVQVVTARVKQLFATLATVAAANPVLLEGEVWIEKDASTGRSTGRRKVGDGVLVGETITGTSFNNLPFEPSAGGGGAPAAHASTHATGGTDAITPGSIGAATAAQGANADSALQASALAPYRTSTAQDTIDAGKAPASGIQPSAIAGTAVVTSDGRLSDSRTPSAHQLSHRANGADAVVPLVQVMGDVNTTVAAGATVVITSAAFTAPRTLTLPAASTIPVGLSITVVDSSGAISANNTLTIQTAGSDTINGATSNSMAAARSARQLFSDGSSSYSFDAGVLRASNNLSDVNSPSVARTNLGARPPKIEVFTASGTWTKETGAVTINAEYFSGGGGGGSGRKNINSGTGNEKSGGGGGGGGGMLRVAIPASRLSATETVTIGAGGPGGLGITATLGNGNAGTQGGSTIFGPFTVPGGLGGGSGNGAALVGAGGAAMMQGNAGGSSGASGVVGGTGAPSSAAAATQPGGPGGAGGGGVNAASTAAAGAAGGRSNLLGLASGTAGAANGGAGGNGQDNTNATNGVFAPGSGGGSGGGGVAVSGGVGGNGGFPAGGGGGGGATETGTTSGAGGTGGGGMLILTTYF